MLKEISSTAIILVFPVFVSLIPFYHIMGRKIPLVSYLCGVLSRKKTPPPNPVEEATRLEDNSRLSTSCGGVDAVTQPLPVAGAAEAQHTDTAQSNDQQQPLPPPPSGGPHQHQRSNSTASCRHQHKRSNSAAARLVYSMSVRVLGSSGGGGAGRQTSGRREEKPRNRDNNKIKLKQEDSVWKKTIILGERCRVPDEDDDSILYDENGNRISTYHPKTHSGVLSYSRQISCIDQEELSRK